jgi:hypothetical protein
MLADGHAVLSGILSEAGVVIAGFLPIAALAAGIAMVGVIGSWARLLLSTRTSAFGTRQARIGRGRLKGVWQIGARPRGGGRTWGMSREAWAAWGRSGAYVRAKSDHAAGVAAREYVRHWG